MLAQRAYIDCFFYLSVELPLVEAVVDRVNISEGARAVLKCRIKSSATDTDIDIRWFHNAIAVNTAEPFTTHQSMYNKAIYLRNIIAVFILVV